MLLLEYYKDASSFTYEVALAMDDVKFWVNDSDPVRGVVAGWLAVCVCVCVKWHVM